ncbi:MAG: T9SS type A sorting domain-containing protein [Candidatus Eisenbacteria sp.]|nr:T9SS type A sorting domain-containing protein [Candidatus Eisenbacteria bacterium]
MRRRLLCIGAAVVLHIVSVAQSGAAQDLLPSPFAGRSLFIDERFTLRPGLLRSGQVDIPVSRDTSPGTLVDSTYYDLQDMGGLGKRIVVAPNGEVHLSYQNGFCYLAPNGCPPDPNEPDPFPKRAMGYAGHAGGSWYFPGKVTDPDLPQCCASPDDLGGYGAIALTPDGRAAIAQHMNQDGCDRRGDVYVDSGVGTGDWEAYLGEITPESYMFPQLVANPNGSFTMLGEVPRGGEHGGTFDVRVAYLGEEGQEIDCQTIYWQFGSWRSIIDLGLFIGETPEFPSIAGGSDGRVAVAVVDNGGNVYLVESSDGTFDPGTTALTNITNYSPDGITDPDSTSCEYRPFVQCDVAYNDTVPHVVWCEMQARKEGDSFYLIDYRSKVKHWSPETGVETVYQIPPGVADLYDEPYLGLPGYYPGFNTATVDWPQVGFSDDGARTYVVWVGFNDTDVDTSVHAGLPGIVLGVGFGDLYFARSDGRGWMEPENITDSPDRDDRYPSLAVLNPDGLAHIVYQTSAAAAAGGSIIGDRDEEPLDLHYILYHEFQTGYYGTVAREETAGLPFSALRCYPNPGRSSVHFSVGVDVGGRIDVSIFDVTGRRVAEVTAVKQAGGILDIEWNGRGDGGSAVASGVYFAALAVDGVPQGVQRFVLVR